MGLIDRNGRLFGLINIIDLLIIGLVVVVVGRFLLELHKNQVAL